MQEQTFDILLRSFSGHCFPLVAACISRWKCHCPYILWREAHTTESGFTSRVSVGKFAATASMPTTHGRVRILCREPPFRGKGLKHHGWMKSMKGRHWRLGSTGAHRECFPPDTLNIPAEDNRVFPNGWKTAQAIAGEGTELRHDP